MLEEAIDVAASAGLFNTVQWALADLGIAHLHQGDPDAARDAFDRASAASEHIGDGAGTVLAAYGYGLLAQTQGDWAEAKERYSSALDGFLRLSTPVPQGLALAGLARCDEAADDLAAARERYEQVLARGRAIGEPALVATALEGLGRVATRDGSPGEGRRLLDEAAVLRQERSRPAPPFERRDLEDLVSG